MIVEMVTCDQCDETKTMRGGLVPLDWASFSGHHYCSLQCVTEAHAVKAR